MEMNQEPPRNNTIQLFLECFHSIKISESTQNDEIVKIDFKYTWS